MGRFLRVGSSECLETEPFWDIRYQEVKVVPSVCTRLCEYSVGVHHHIMGSLEKWKNSSGE